MNRLGPQLADQLPPVGSTPRTWPTDQRISSSVSAATPEHRDGMFGNSTLNLIILGGGGGENNPLLYEGGGQR